LFFLDTNNKDSFSEVASNSVTSLHSAQQVKTTDSFDFTYNQGEIVSPGRLEVQHRNVPAFEVESKNQSKMRGMSQNEKEMAYSFGGVCCCIGVILMLVLLPLSFRTLAEDEIAFRKSSVSSKIDFEEIYCCGHFHLGPTGRFASVSRHVHTVFIEDSNAWTCPAENGTCKEISGNTNEVGQTIYSSFAVNFRIIRDIENAKLAYEKYQFDDGRVRQAVVALAIENSKETPQQYSVEQIYASYSDDAPQIVVDHELLDADLRVFGYELQDVVVTEIKMPEAAQAKFLVQEIRKYQDDIIRNSWIADETRLLTAGMVNEINIEGISATRKIQADANATVARLDADLEAYRRFIDISATTYLIEMYKRNFQEASEVEIAELTASHQYVDNVMSTGSGSHVNTLFMGETNRLFTQEINSS